MTNFSCPFCNTPQLCPVMSLSRNFALEQMVDSFNQAKSEEMCNLHNRPYELSKLTSSKLNVK